jgi:hypothetical protein
MDIFYFKTLKLIPSVPKFAPQPPRGVLLKTSLRQALFTLWRPSTRGYSDGFIFWLRRNILVVSAPF